MNVDELISDELRQQSIGKTVRELYHNIDNYISEIHRAVIDNDFDYAETLTDNLKSNILILSAVLEHIEQSKEV
jgi:hypothetical protein